jgi:Asp-tRNA(Asn)/Glu-tRNA(Gln) amidotransferase A subunit family amidase
MQVMAPHLEDRTALRFAKQLEDVLGGFVPPPGLA